MSKNMKMKAVMAMAWRFVHDAGLPLGEAMRRAYLNLKLKAAMLLGKGVHFKFLKKDGTVREAFGTLAQAAINYIPNGLGHPAPERVQRYWDLEKAEYRCFLKANLQAVM